MFTKRALLTAVGAFGGFFLVLFFVFWALDTEFFRGDPEQGGQETPIRNEKTALAYAFCAQHVAKERRQETATAPAVEDYTAWDLGFNRYLIKAPIEHTDRPASTGNYLCRIKWRGSDEQSPDSWVVQSVEYVQ
jgi:hypothetical protein